MKGEGHTVLDIVPVDIVVNLLIASSWHKGLTKNKSIDIYHCSTGGLHPFRWGQMGITSKRLRSATHRKSLQSHIIVFFSKKNFLI